MNYNQDNDLTSNINIDAYMIVKKILYVTIGCWYVYCSTSMAGSIPPPPPCAPPAAPTITASNKPCEPKDTQQAEVVNEYLLNENSELIKMLSDYIASQNKHHS